MLTYWKPFLGWKSKFEVISSLQDWIEPPDRFKNLGLKMHLWRCSSSLLFHHFSPFFFHFFHHSPTKNRKQQQEEGVTLVQRVWHRKKSGHFSFSFLEAMGFFNVLLWRGEVIAKEITPAPVGDWKSWKDMSNVCSFKMLKLSGKRMDKRLCFGWFAVCCDIDTFWQVRYGFPWKPGTYANSSKTGCVFLCLENCYLVGNEAGWIAT